MKKAKICIADDHILFRDGLFQLINLQPDMEVLGVAKDGLEMLTLHRELQPDLILMDITMPISDGIEGTRLIREYDADVTILMLTALDSDDKLIESIRAGADGYLLKKTSSEGLLRALRGALKGETSLPRHLTTRLIKEYTDAIAEPPSQPTNSIEFPTLTARELQVLELIAAGASNKQIAIKLGISLYTTKSHVRNLLSKLGVMSRWQAVQVSNDMGLLRIQKQSVDRGIKD